MKKKSAVLAGLVLTIAIVSSVAIVAKFYKKPINVLEYSEEYKTTAPLSKEELKELKEAEAKVLQEIGEEKPAVDDNDMNKMPMIEMDETKEKDMNKMPMIEMDDEMEVDVEKE